MNQYKSSRNHQATNLNSFQRGNFASQEYFPDRFSQTQPLQLSNGTQPSQEKFFSPPCGKENMSSPLVLCKGIKSDQGKLAFRVDSAVFDEKIIKVKQRSEKNYRDLNKSLANLIRVPGSSSSGDDMLANKEVSVTANLDPKLDSHKGHSLSNRGTSSNLVKKNQARTPQVSSMNEYNKVLQTEANDYFPVQKEKLYQNKSGTSKIIYHKSQKKIAEMGKGFFHQKGLYTPNNRQLLTEGDLPSHQVDNSFLFGSVSPCLMQKVHEKERQSTQSGLTGKIGPKLHSSGAKPMEARNLDNKKAKQAQEILDFNIISEGVMYGEGGVAIHRGGKRQKQQEGECMIAAQENPKKGEDLEKTQKITGETMKLWKCELLEIQRDIEKRKLSYEKVNKFFTICDENNSFMNSLDDNALGDTGSTFSIQKNLNFTQSRHTHQSLQTLPNQTPSRLELANSPTLSSRRHLVYGNSSLNEKISLGKQQNKKLLSDVKAMNPNPNRQPTIPNEAPIANDSQSRVKTLSHFEYNTYETQEIFSSFVGENQIDRKACCGKTSGCTIF